MLSKDDKQLTMLCCSEHAVRSKSDLILASYCKTRPVMKRGTHHLFYLFLVITSVAQLFNVYNRFKFCKVLKSLAQKSSSIDAVFPRSLARCDIICCLLSEKVRCCTATLCRCVSKSRSCVSKLRSCIETSVFKSEMQIN